MRIFLAEEHKMLKALVLTAFAALLATSALATEYRGGTKDDYAAIEAIEPAWKKAYAARDVEALLDLYTEDCIAMFRGRPAMFGRESLRKGFTNLLATVEPQLVSDVDELVVRGDWAWTVARVMMIYRPLDGSASRTDYARALLMYEKGKDGRWRIARDIDTPSPDAESLAKPN
jgi:uncharacterized protein (TIGR02246 family)